MLVTFATTVLFLLLPTHAYYFHSSGNNAGLFLRQISKTIPGYKIKNILKCALNNNAGHQEPALRIGHGFDIHRLIEGTKLVIGGVEIPFHLGADAHSDGDALYHSVVDSILGALALPDIGQLFPDNDPTWKGADSSIFMKEAYKKMSERGYQIGNLDVTLILQTPKVKDIKPLMKQNLVSLLQTTDSRVNIKARTHEKVDIHPYMHTPHLSSFVDSIGESRSYACHVVVILEKAPMS